MKDTEYSTTPRQCLYWVDCKLIQDNLGKMPELIQRIHERYCTGQDVLCARRQLHEQIGGHVVPPLMLPEQTDWATQIIDEYEVDPMADAHGGTV